jgi:ketosteroid isomerase-like protein
MAGSIDSFLGEWSAAERAGDTVKLDSLLTEDFVGIGPVGFSLPKTEWLARHQQGLSYESFGLDETTVRIHGDAAIVTARLTQRGTAFGNPIPEAVRATCVLVRQREHWRLASAHMSFIAGTPGAPPIPGAGTRPPGQAGAG